MTSKPPSAAMSGRNPVDDIGNDQAPDLIGPVIAYRAWRVADRFTTDGTTDWDEGPRLGSMLHGQPWPPGMDMHAHCLFDMVMFGVPARAPHRAPVASCQCGFYVMHTLDDLLNEPSQIARLRHSTKPAVAGEVEVWGRSERYTRGRRVEWCRVRSIYRTPLNGDVDVGALAAVYGVPVLDDPDGKIAAWRQQEPEPSRWHWSPVGSTVVINSGYRTYVQQAANTMARSMQEYCDAMKKAMDDLAKVTRLPADALTDPGSVTDPDKPIPSRRKDHLSFTADHRSPRSIRKKGVRNGRPR